VTFKCSHLGESIGISSATFPSAKSHPQKPLITDLTSTTFTYMPKVSLYPRENKPTFAVSAVVGIAYPWPHFGDALIGHYSALGGSA
jgi:hypothetical protein